jgi:hypothetical protein
VIGSTEVLVHAASWKIDSQIIKGSSSETTNLSALVAWYKYAAVLTNNGTMAQHISACNPTMKPMSPSMVLAALGCPWLPLRTNLIQESNPCIVPHTFEYDNAG